MNALRRSASILEASGYEVMTGSLGPFDLLGLSETDLVLCRVVTGAWPNDAEFEGLQLFRAPTNGRKIIHRWQPRQRLPETRRL